ncbi:MAG: DUF6448 family protein [Candidatus Krumholzibacteriia bacterium]
MPSPKLHSAAILVLAAAAAFLAAAGPARAHCDAEAGPLIPQARAALDAGDVTPLLKWVQPGDEAEVAAVFAQARAVRQGGPEARELADRHFVETLVRLHRAGEGAPYTGIKTGPIDPVTAMADEALAGGSADEMIGRLQAHLATAVRERFAAAAATAAEQETSTEAGRRHVAAYVAYMHYLENLHRAIADPDAHAH